ncbi:MAG: DUF4012 domain-containing protein, partial [Candidatus Colwellbacteria bacterium]|nr:DUF4012 domain-containing protein [Candidatus Colwellbacteria bacterium]
MPWRKKKEPEKEFRRKNISPVLADVKHPSVSRFYSPHSLLSPASKKKTKKEEINKTRRPKERSAPVASVFRKPNLSFELTSVSASRKRRETMKIAVPAMIVTLVLSGVLLWKLKENIVFSAKALLNNFQSAVQAAKAYDIDGLRNDLYSADGNIKDIEKNTAFLKIIPFLKQIPAFASTIKNMNDSAFSVISLTDELKNNGMNWIWNDGQKLLSTLKKIRSAADDISTFGGLVRNKMASLGMADGFSGNYLSVQSELYGATGLLDGVISLLEGESYFTVFFMNDSEMRPTGGFIGSYAVLKLANGEIEDISVN